MSGADVYVAFGGDTGALEAAASVVKAEMQALQREMQGLAREFKRAGAAAESEVGRQLKAVGDEMAAAKEKSRDLAAELAKIGHGANDNFKHLSADFKKLTESVAENAYQLGPWSGQHVDLAKTATLALGNALSGAGAAVGALGIAFGVMAAAAAGAAAVVASQVTNLRNLDDAARAAGISMQALNNLNTSGASVGIDPAQMNQEMAGFAQKLREAQVAGGDLADFLEKNNVEIKDARGNLLPVQQIFGKIAELVMSSNNEMDRLATLTKLGFSADMLRLIERQSDAVKAFAASAKSAQDEVLKQGMADGEALSAAWNGVWADIKGAALSASVSVLGAIGDILHEGSAKFTELGNHAAATFHRITGDAQAAARASQAAFEAQRNEMMRQAHNAVREGKSPFGGLDLNAFGERKKPDQQSDKPTIKGLYGEDDDDKKKTGKGDNDAVRAAQAEIEGELQALRAGLDAKKTIIAESVKLKIMGDREAVAATRQATNDEYAAERALLDRELQIEGLKPSQRQQINNRIQQLEAKHNQDMLKLAGQNVEAIVKEWHKMSDAMASSLSSSISGMITGQKKLIDAVRDMARAIINEFVRMGVTMVADWAKAQASRVAMAVAKEGELTAAVTAGVATRQAAEASGETAGFAMKAAAMAKSIMASASETFAGVFGFLSPVMGPAAAGPAAAAEATVAAVASFDVGAWKIDRDQLAVVHRNEMVMTSGQSEGLRNVIDAARGGAGASQGSPNISVAPQIHINAIDARGVSQLLKDNHRAVMDAVAHAARRGVHLATKG